MVLTQGNIVKADLISVPFVQNSTQTKIPFPDQPQLRGVFVENINFPCVKVDYYGKRTENQDATYLQRSYLTLFFEGRESVVTIPLIELTSNRGAFAYNHNGQLGFAGQQIVWPKCYITLCTPTPDVVSDAVFLFLVTYRKTI